MVQHAPEIQRPEPADLPSLSRGPVRRPIAAGGLCFDVNLGNSSLYRGSISHCACSLSPAAQQATVLLEHLLPCLVDALLTGALPV